MRKLLIVSLVSWATAAGSGCCTSRPPALACGTAPAICSPIQCGSCGCPQVSQGVPTAYGSDGVGPVMTAPIGAPSLSPAPGTMVSPSLAPAPSLATPVPSATSTTPNTFAPNNTAPGNIPPSGQ